MLTLAVAMALALSACVTGGDPDDLPDAAQQTADGEQTHDPGSRKVVTEEEGAAIPLKLTVWDDTIRNAPEGAEIVAGDAEPWQPEFGKVGAATQDSGEVIVGENLDVSVFPDGAEGAGVVASIFIDPERLPRMDEPLDVIVYIEDKTVLIESTFVGYIEEFERP